MVRNTVGSEPSHTSFELHANLLAFCSGYSDKALNGDFAEAKSREISVKTEDPKNFELFHFWLYTKRFWPKHQTRKTALS
ncbi:hypothetical protein LTS12_026213 [Elasticomyces elasticus]|nr:hypothetical protein LTS12_026213 [Elasticomyces elasticus]